MQCSLPILKYGRMMQCKHVACYDCASKCKVCPKCDNKVEKIMKKELGSIFICTHGGTKHGIGGCGRTYFSLRDLQAHMDHRHSCNPPPAKDPRVTVEAPPAHKAVESPPLSPAPSSIPVVSTRTSNLITVPIQDDYRPTYTPFPANFSQPPPLPPLYATPPPILRPPPYVAPNIPPPPHPHWPPSPRLPPHPHGAYHRPYYH
ncbi:CBLL1 [Cordylochernes scorpioides]|uniref:E3 ubiquitin-protein ligase Hakai n=1 Tax=Cordylochernes scorpioides TaxID=51811 RepID=A0ABY6LIU5_9ARAC|nr:CBLL1 [Cordylochernes scorpioides]